MITADLHTHTRYSHGKSGAREMFAAGRQRGITLHGFSEHSPRPDGYDYPSEYRTRLARAYPDYVREVLELKEQHPAQILFGMEMDWMEAETNFIRQAVSAYDFDYLIGSVHFVGTWGYDYDAADWKNLSFEQRAAHYERYFRILAGMAASRLFNIAAHPDLIKIFSIDTFRQWLTRHDALDLVRESLVAIRDAGMSMEISSAGLRKPCKEIYPGPEIMRLAADLRVPVVFGSDAHQPADMAFAFDELARYAA
ncbi:MAG: histidinol-phosphatase, partial [Betaproteobacteria bacterium]|nr:histidinol-phosphatase [Betaproteobacteria bacterium]